VHGLRAIPQRWVDELLNCRPEAGRSNVWHPRPECFWPVDALHVAQCLIAGGRAFRGKLIQLHSWRLLIRVYEDMK